MLKKKPLTLTEFARMGAEAQLKKYGRRKRSEWGRLGGYPKGRPRKKPKKWEAPEVSRGEGITSLQLRKKHTRKGTRNATQTKRQSNRVSGRLTREEYDFKCKLRNPEFQKDLLRFFRDFPVFYRVSKDAFASFGSLESKARKELRRFLAKNALTLRKLEETEDHVVYKFEPNSVRAATALRQLENELFDMEWKLMLEANRRFDAEPEHIVERIRTHEWIIRLPEFAKPDYFSRIKYTPSEYSKREDRFTEKWGFFPYWSRSLRPRMVVGREDVPYLDREIKLFIPVTETLTKEDLKGRWLEIAKRQSHVYGRKKRPRATNYEKLIKIYDLKKQDWRNSDIAEELGISVSDVERDYRRTFSRIHGFKPGKARKSKKIRVRTRGESDEDTLRVTSFETGIPLEKLREHQLLTAEERALLWPYLHKRIQDQQKSRIRPIEYLDS